MGGASSSPRVVPFALARGRVPAPRRRIGLGTRGSVPAPPPESIRPRLGAVRFGGGRVGMVAGWGWWRTAHHRGCAARIPHWRRRVAQIYFDGLFHFQDSALAQASGRRRRNSAQPPRPSCKFPVSNFKGFLGGAAPPPPIPIFLL